MSQNLRLASCCGVACVSGHAATTHWKHRHPLLSHHLLLAETADENSRETVADETFCESGMGRGRKTQLRALGDDSRQSIQSAVRLAKASLFENAIVPPNLKVALDHSGAFFGYFLCTSKESDSREARKALRALARKLLISSLHPSHDNNTQARQGRGA